MPTECERSATPPTATNITITAHIEQKDLNNMDKDMDSEMSTSTGSTSSTITNGLTASNGGNKKCVTTPCSTAYVAKARVTRPTPPPPSCNPLQFVQIKPCNLYQTAQQQLKKAEEVKMIKEIKKEEPEDWQNNLDSWKSSRRKRVEHIIDRVVEVKKLELEEHDRSRRKSKTFSEMIEERGERGVRGGRAKLVSLAVYNEEETNDLSDLGIGTSSASGKSSLSEDYDNNSVMSDTAELDKAIFDSNHPKSSITREYISSPGYDTSSSTAPASSPDPCEYTYEGAIQDYKQRVSRATSGGSTGFNANSNTRNKNQTKTPSSTSVISIELTSEIAGNSAMATGTYPARRGSKIEERLIGFEVSSPNDSQDALEKNKVDVPKIDISKRKELFESATCNNMMATSIEPKLGNSTAVPRVTLRDRFVIDTNESLTEKQTASKKDIKRLSGDMTSIKDRMQSLEQQHNLINITNGSTKTSTAKKVDIPVPPLKERLSSLQSAATKEETKKPVVLVDARQLEIMKDEEENAILRMKCLEATSALITKPVLLEENSLNKSAETEADRDDSGIHTSDDIEEDQLLRQTQEQQLNEAIAALAIEEKQLEQAANAVNQIEAEFEELSSTNISVPLVVLTTTTTTTETNVQPCEMEFSVSSTNNLSKSTAELCKNSRSYLKSNVEKSTSILNDNVVVAAHKGGSSHTNAMPSSEPSPCSLRRKPSNEMVHARNLLKMFKGTFNNDIDLDEEVEPEDATIKAESSPKIQSPTLTNNAIVLAQNFTTPATYSSQNDSTSPTITSIPSYIFQSSATNFTYPQKPILPQTPPSLPTKSPESFSKIPHFKGPTGKPPMSPKLLRSPPTKSVPQSPLNSPSPTRKPESNFSINGRVEIFNSKNMECPLKSSSPTMSAKKSATHLPYLPVTSNSKHEELSFTSNNNSQIMLPQQHQSSKATEPLTISNKTKAVAESMPPKTFKINESQVLHSNNVVLGVVSSPAKPQHQAEIIDCASHITVINPDELPKANTVRDLSSCFSNDYSKTTPLPATPLKPLLRSRISLTPPESPQPSKRNASIIQNDAEKKATNVNNPSLDRTNLSDLSKGAKTEEEHKKLSLISNSSTISIDSNSASGPFETKAIVHSIPLSTQKSISITESLFTPTVDVPVELPSPIVCTPNESSLYKLTSSPSISPISSNQPSPTDIAICSSFLSSFIPTPAKSLQIPAAPIRQQTVEEIACDKIDVRKLPSQSQVPATSWFEVSPDEVKRCDNLNYLNLTYPTTPTRLDKPNVRPNSKPNSPIMAARAAHSKALIETCEKIIAEERQARSQINSSLPTTPTSQKSTPILSHKSKIPKPIPCCLSGSDSMSNADFERSNVVPITSLESNSATGHNKDDDDGLLIARLHVVETQIKVTTTTPPASPKANNEAHPNNKSASNKKTKNIFDFLKRNFSHQTPHDENIAEIPAIEAPVSTATNADIVKVDNIFTVDNSRFYVPSAETPVPPLPLTPAPVNIKITRKITTDEILEESNSELALSQEINDMLDDELNKLSLESAVVVGNE